MMSYGLFTGGAGDALRRGEGRLPGHPGRPGHLGAAVDADAGLPDHRRPHPAQLRPLLRQLPRAERASTRARTSPCARPLSAPNPTPRRPAAGSSKAFGCDVYNSYGLTEMNGPGVAFECEYKAGLHLWEDNFILEIINPAHRRAPARGPDRRAGAHHASTARPCPSSATAPGTSPPSSPSRCKCGRTHRRLNRITGRSDDMLIIRGVNIFPQQIERVLMSFPQVGRNYVIMHRGPGRHDHQGRAGRRRL